MQFRHLSRVVGGALVAASLLSLAGPGQSAHAAPGGAMTAPSGTFLGTQGDDLLIVGRDGDALTHNRFAAGDAGFNSAKDFDSAQSGDQTRTVGVDGVSFDLGDGNDVVKLVGTFPTPLQSGGDKNLGQGRDTLDFSGYATAAVQGVVFGQYGSFPVYGLDEVIGTAFNDGLILSYLGEAGVTANGGAGDDSIAGTVGDDHLEGGGGKDHIEAIDGDDTVVVSAPFAATRDFVYGMDGDDTLTVRGTTGNDDLLLQRGGIVTDLAHPDGGFGSSDFEHYRIETGNGDDIVDVAPVADTRVDAGAGDDVAFLNAYKSTASVTTAGSDRLVTLPIYAKRADRGNQTTRLVATEELSIYNETMIATSPGRGGGPHIRTFRADGTPVDNFYAYARGFTGGVNLALGDLDGDVDDEIVTAPGSGGGPHVRVFRSDGTDTGVSFMAYADNFFGGVNLATADLDGDGVDEIVTAPASGGGAHVRIWSGDGELLDEWMAKDFGTTGISIARGPRHPLFDEAERLIVSASSLGTRVAVFEADGSPAEEGYNPFSPYGAFGGGASAARAEVDPFDPFATDDYFNEIVTGAGVGGGPHIQLFSPNGTNFVAQSSFMAYDPNFRGGVELTTCNPDGGDDEIMTAPGFGGGPHVRMFAKTGTVKALNFMAYDPAFRGGVHMACGGAETKAY